MEELDRPKTFTFRGAWFRAGGQELHLLLAEDTTSPAGWKEPGEIRTDRARPHVALEVDDLHGARARLESHGVGLFTGPLERGDGIVQVYVLDPDGHLIELFERTGSTTRAGPCRARPGEGVTVGRQVLLGGELEWETPYWGRMTWVARPDVTAFAAGTSSSARSSSRPAGSTTSIPPGTGGSAVRARGPGRATAGEEKRELGPGESLFVARDVVHASFHVSDGISRILVVVGPCVGKKGYRARRGSPTRRRGMG